MLLVEDDLSIREAVKEILELSGYLVETAIHGADAFEKLKAASVLPSLILLDLNMPVMSGKEFLERLRAASEEYARIPVLLMSAVPNQEIEGVAGVLKKPVGMKAILESVGSFREPNQ